MRKHCESLKYVIRRDLLREVDGEVWLGKFDEHAEENPPNGSVLLHYCPLCGDKLDPEQDEQ